MRYRTIRKEYDTVNEAMGDGVGGFGHGGQSITDPWLDPTGHAPVDPRDFYGFKEVQTGGGCTALQLVDDSGAEVLLTAAMDPVVPDCRHDWALGIYRDPEGGGEAEWTLRVQPGEPVVHERLEPLGPTHDERRRRLRVNGEPTTLGALYEVNRDMYNDDPAALRRLLALEPGDDMRTGGGALAETYILRCRDEPEPGSVDAKTAFRRLSEASHKLEEAADLLGDSRTYWGNEAFALSVEIRKLRDRWNEGR